ncbi:MAG TPA: oligopeptide/dipeptide ABC transporter ATP-binding protein [Gaiellaceae bacterium]|nr:oligopeptide/dipeptide ABC transporter ATP-binding protein [Gaiellaceae bacterium]
MSCELVSTEGLTRDFAVGRGLGATRTLRAVDGVDLEVRKGEILGVVGESGSGKSTLGRLLLRLLEPTSGRILFDGADLSRLDRRGVHAFRRRAQPIYQDPYSSLDPRWRVARTIREPLDAFGLGTAAERETRVAELLEAVGLSERHGAARPHQLSGGQRQRAAIAAAIAPRPDLVVADEPVSALDVLVQAQILNLIASLQREFGLTIVFITHNLSVVEHLADRVAVMYLGRIVELGRTAEVLRDPQHPYTRALIDSVPHPDPARGPDLSALRGEIPSPIDPPAGCRFHTRCPIAVDLCTTVDPPLRADASGRVVACHLAQLDQHAA